VGCALATKDGAARRDALRIAGAAVRRIERDNLVWGRPLATALAAAVAGARGDRAGQAALLGRAVEEAQRARMKAHAAAAQLARGVCLGGDEGAALCADARATLAAESIVRPARLAAVLVPVV